METLTIPIENASYPVLALPGRPKALLDRTVAEIYGVQTREVNQAARNNMEKFPPDFFFELTIDEAKSLNEIENFDLAWEKGHPPKAYTHLGCNMLATILKSELAVRRAVEIIRAFTALENAILGPESRNVLKMISSQSRMISVLAEEMYANRSQIEDHESRVRALESKLRLLGGGRRSASESGSISSSQTALLRDLVKDKAESRKQIAAIWTAFKKHFRIARYRDLPGSKFEEARQWLKNLLSRRLP